MMRQVILILLIALSNSFSTGRFAIPLLAVLALAVSQRFFREANKGWQAFLLLWLVWGATTAFAWSGATAMHYSGAMVEFGFFMAMMPIAIIPLVIDRVFHRRVLRGGGNLLLLSLVLPITVAALTKLAAQAVTKGTNHNPNMAAVCASPMTPI